MSWLRDAGIVLLFVAGNQVRHGAFAAGATIQMCAVILFMERFVWQWQLNRLQEARSRVKRGQ